MSDARYIVFEGGEGSGKSTQARRLAEHLDAHLTFEPGATPLGARIRTLVLDVDADPVGARAEALLMAADRAQHLETVIEPTLASGRHVVSDRSLYSSLAYQGGGRGLGVSDVAALNRFALADRLPDLVVLLDLDVEAASQRLDRHLDRMEQAGADFHRVVFDTYRVLAAADPDRWLVIDADQPIDDLTDQITRRVEERIR